MDYAALHSEIVNAPASKGYAAFVSAGNDQGVADLLNAPNGSISRGVISKDLFVTLAMSPLSALYTLEKTDPTNALYVALYPMLKLLEQASSIDTSLSPIQNALAGCVAGGIMTDAEKANCLTRAGSRAEVLFGADAFVSGNDVARAQGRF